MGSWSPPPWFKQCLKKNILFFQGPFPCDLVVIFCKPYSSKTEWHTDKVAIITDNFWHQEKYLQWPCWTVRLCDSTITDFCMNPQQKGESDSFPVYQFLRAAMAMSVKGRSVSRHTTHVQLHVHVGGKRAAVANGVLVERSTAHLAETFKEGSGGGQPAFLLPSGHPSLSCLVSTLDFEMNDFDICIKERPIMFDFHLCLIWRNISECNCES